MTRLVARNLAHLIDEATPYRRGQPSLVDRAMYVRPSWHMASVYVAGVLVVLAWLYTR